MGGKILYKLKLGSGSNYFWYVYLGDWNFQSFKTQVSQDLLSPKSNCCPFMAGNSNRIEYSRFFNTTLCHLKILIIHSIFIKIPTNSVMTCMSADIWGELLSTYMHWNNRLLNTNFMSMIQMSIFWVVSRYCHWPALIQVLY